MRIGDALLLSPNYLFRDLDFTHPDQLAVALQPRVDGFYLRPAERLIASKGAFAAAQEWAHKRYGNAFKKLAE